MASVFLTLAMLLSIAPLGTVTAFAANDASDTDAPTWTITAYTYSSESDKTITLPSSSPTADTTITVDGGSVTIKGDSGTTYNYLTIVIEGGAEVTIQDLSIKNDASSDDIPAVDVQSADDGNTLYVDRGTCTLQGGLYQPGIRVEGSNQITIDKAPGVTDDNSAVLNACSSWFAAAIGGRGNSSGNASGCGTVNIKGGKLSAYTSQAYTPTGDGAGIGGGGGGYGGSGGTVNITGGIVTANGGLYGGAGIGGGGARKGADAKGSSVDNTEGKITENRDKYSGAGIGGAGASTIMAASGGTVNITGGTVTANGGEYGGAGIGGGGSTNTSGSTYNGGAGGNVKINGGTVFAYGGKGGYSGDWNPHCGGGAGIGGGGGYTGGAGGDIEISGGDVTAESNYYGTDTTVNRSGGAGIGGGGSYQDAGSSCGTVTIGGSARVTASATTLGAGIGAGVGSAGTSDGGGAVTISGGMVTAAGADTGEDIGGSATANYFDGGSINAGTENVTIAPVLTSGTAVYKTTVQVPNISAATLVSCEVSGSTFSAYTDASGYLYLWLTENTQADSLLVSTDTANHYLGIGSVVSSSGTNSWSSSAASVVTFDKSGGGTEATPSSTAVIVNGTVTLPTTDPTRTGYTFAGWNTKADGSGTEFTSSTNVTSDITVYAQWTANTYNITYNLNGGTNNANNPSVYTYGSAATLGDPTKTGYTFGGWYTDSGFTGTAVTEIDDALAGHYADGATINLYAKWTGNSSGGGSGSATTYYTITVSAGTGGSISPSGSASVAFGGSKTYTIMPSDGYKIKDVLVDGASAGAVRSYTFESVKKAHTISASFAKKETVSPFADVKGDDWFYDSVMYVYQNGLMGGTGTDTFSPDTAMTRQMIWMVLARMDGKDPASMDEAKAWAVENKISDGTDPANSITREQLAAILYRYAQYKGYDTTQGGMAIREFSDYDNISTYAQSALGWAVNAGLVQGNDKQIMPSGTATRAQVATILMRFSQNVAK